MSDNTQIPGSDNIATDDIGGVKFQRFKLVLGADGVNDGDVSSANPVPVQGSFYPETQPVSAGALPLPAGASTEVTLAALKAAVDALSAKIATCNTGAVTLDSATLAALETITISNPTPQGLTDSQLRSSALSVTVSNPTAQGLTDAQLRAAAVPVTVSNPTAQGLTDTQLRATAVPVSLASVEVSNFPTTVSIDNFPVGGSGLTDTELRATALPVTVAGAAQDVTVVALQALNDTMLYMLAAILEKMPRVTGNDQAAVSIEAGAVGIFAGQTLATVTTVGTVSNMTNIGGKQVAQLPDAISQLGALHLYRNIIVS